MDEVVTIRFLLKTSGFFCKRVSLFLSEKCPILLQKKPDVLGHFGFFQRSAIFLQE